MSKSGKDSDQIDDNKSKSSSRTTSSKSSSRTTSSKSSKATSYSQGRIGGNSSDWIGYQARLRKSRRIRKGSTIKSEKSSKSGSKSKSSRSVFSFSESSGRKSKKEDNGGTIRSEAIRGDKSSVRSVISMSKPEDDVADTGSIATVKDAGNEENTTDDVKLASDDASSSET